MDYTILLDKYGLPITLLAVFLWFIVKMYDDNNKRNQAREDMLYVTIADVNAINKEVSETNKGLTETNKQLTETNQELVQQFKTEVLIMKNDIEDIKHAVLK